MTRSLLAVTLSVIRIEEEHLSGFAGLRCELATVRRKAKQTPLLVPVPGQVIGHFCQRYAPGCTSFKQRFYQIWGEKRDADHFAHMTLAFARCRGDHA